MALSVWDENIWHLFGILEILKYIYLLTCVRDFMKTVHLHLEDEQYARLIEAKKDRNWIEFVMQLAEKKEARNVKKKV